MSDFWLVERAGEPIGIVHAKLSKDAATLAEDTFGAGGLYITAQCCLTPEEWDAVVAKLFD